MMSAEAHSIQCCSPDGQIRVPEEYASPLCFPILIPQDDPVYSRFQQMCMNFVRSTTYLDTGCGSPHEPAEQVYPRFAKILKLPLFLL